MQVTLLNYRVMKDLKLDKQVINDFIKLKNKQIKKTKKYLQK